MKTTRSFIVLSDVSVLVHTSPPATYVVAPCTEVVWVLDLFWTCYEHDLSWFVMICRDLTWIHSNSHRLFFLHLIIVILKKKKGAPYNFAAILKKGAVILKKGAEILPQFQIRKKTRRKKNCGKIAAKLRQHCSKIGAKLWSPFAKLRENCGTLFQNCWKIAEGAFTGDPRR